jgi:putative phosphoribosyl transferase
MLSAEGAIVFQDRREAGRVLAEALLGYANRPAVIVLGLPRGGVPVAYEVSRALHAPFDVFLVRKLGLPGQEELAMGAIASGGVRVLNDDVVSALGLSNELIEQVAQRERRVLAERERQYRGDRPPLDVGGRVVIVVDDGLATGSSMRAAVAALHQQTPSKIVVAVPVASASTCRELAREVDEVVCAQTPEPFYAVGLWYRDFSPTSDDEVRELLDASVHEPISAP